MVKKKMFTTYWFNTNEQAGEFAKITGNMVLRGIYPPAVVALEGYEELASKIQNKRKR